MSDIFPCHAIVVIDGKDKYICNQAVKPSPMKSCHRYRGVTCKNCQRILKKGEFNIYKVKNNESKK